MAWRIVKWSREEGRGEIVSGLGRLEFDAGVALVDDFEVGELVEVQLSRLADSWRVDKIWPDVPHFRAPTLVQPAAGTPPLRPDLRESVAKLLNGVDCGDHDYRWEAQESRITFSIQDRGDAYARPETLLLHGVRYAELACDDDFDLRLLRLATDSEREYLATRTTVDADAIALCMISYDRRFYFVVCAELEHGGARAPRRGPG